MKQVLAADFGASSGRVMLGRYDGASVSLEELHRFSNDPVILTDTMYWDVLRLYFEVQQGILKSKAAGGADSIGVDTWGVDFGLLDKDGKLLGNPVHYRDSRTAGMIDEVFRHLDREKFYQTTGTQFMEINTVFQLLALKQKQKELLDQAEAFLLMPDLFHYFLSGVMQSEISIASTTQLLDMRKRDWSSEVFGGLGLPERLAQKIVPGGTKAGTLRPALCRELGVGPMEVISVAGHDTESAVAAVPAKDKDFLFLSCGTWSLFGTETEEPVITAESARLNIANEIGMEGKYCFLKNIIGLWLIQESRRQWAREGKSFSFGELEQLALGAEPFVSLIDPDAPEFVPAGDMPARIREYCRRTGQKEPRTEGEIVRCIDQSLALAYRRAAEEIRVCTGKQYPALHLIGGGVQSRLLCQMTADACGIPVYAGPVEATAYGNVICQLIAAGELAGLSEAREMIRVSEKPAVYEPHAGEQWEEAYQRFRRLR